MKDQWIEIFKAGKQTDSKGNTKEWKESDLDEIVSKHNEKKPEENAIAPIVLGHPKDNDPAYGWVGTLKREGKSLYAKLRDLAPEFVTAVKEKRFSNRSVSLRNDNSLVHLGFLGAVLPAVKGLAPISFNSDENTLTYEFSQEQTQEPQNSTVKTEEPNPTEDNTQMLINNFLEGNTGMEEFIQALSKDAKAQLGDEAANKVLALINKHKGLISTAGGTPKPENKKFSEDPEIKAVMDAYESKLAALAARDTQRELEVREMKFNEYWNEKVNSKEPKVKPAQKEEIRLLYNALIDNSQTFEFKEGAEKKALNGLQLLDKVIEGFEGRLLFSSTPEGNSASSTYDFSEQDKAIEEFNKKYGR